MDIQRLRTVYRYDGIDLPVPSHLAGNPEALKAYHAGLYPAITTAEATERGIENGVLVIEYRRAVGTKGRVDANIIDDDTNNNAGDNPLPRFVDLVGATSTEAGVIRTPGPRSGRLWARLSDLVANDHRHRHAARIAAPSALPLMPLG